MKYDDENCRANSIATAIIIGLAVAALAVVLILEGKY